MLKELEKRLGYEKEKGEKVIEGLKAADVENKALQKVSMEFYSQTNTSMDKIPILSASELNRIYNLLLEAWRRGRASDLWSVDTCQSWVQAPSKAHVVSLSKKLYSNCLVLVGSRNGFEQYLHKQIKLK